MVRTENVEDKSSQTRGTRGRVAQPDSRARKPKASAADANLCAKDSAGFGTIDRHRQTCLSRRQPAPSAQLAQNARQSKETTPRLRHPAKVRCRVDMHRICMPIKGPGPTQSILGPRSRIFCHEGGVCQRKQSWALKQKGSHLERLLLHVVVECLLLASDEFRQARPPFRLVMMGNMTEAAECAVSALTSLGISTNLALPVFAPLGTMAEGTNIDARLRGCYVIGQPDFIFGILR